MQDTQILEEATSGVSKPTTAVQSKIQYLSSGDLLKSPCQTYVNAVNCVGVMGKGIALKFRQTFPGMYQDYLKKCHDRELVLQKPYLYHQDPGPWIINFPTKGHWRTNSVLSDIDQGLAYLAQHIPVWGVTSVAIPALGCGEGGLVWADVHALILEHLGPLGISIDLYLPQHMPKHTRSMTQPTDKKSGQKRGQSTEFFKPSLKKIASSTPVEKTKNNQIGNGPTT